jgi:hypothetical protein
MINKPIKILRREQPIRNRANESEGKDEAALLDKLTLDVSFFFNIITWGCFFIDLVQKLL